eukprot:6108757-Alexandrium_andersonii.AAC.1
MPLSNETSSGGNSRPHSTAAWMESSTTIRWATSSTSDSGPGVCDMAPTRPRSWTCGEARANKQSKLSARLLRAGSASEPNAKKRRKSLRGLRRAR